MFNVHPSMVNYFDATLPTIKVDLLKKVLKCNVKLKQKI